MTQQNTSSQGNRGRGRPFKPGQSGNPAGRPKGSRSISTLMMDKLEENGDRIIAALFERAEKGDTSAIKFIIDKCMPTPKGPLVTFDLPEPRPDGSMDLPRVHEAILKAVSEGQIAPADASHASDIIKNIADAHQITRLLTNAERLEEEVRSLA